MKKDNLRSTSLRHQRTNLSHSIISSARIRATAHRGHQHQSLKRHQAGEDAHRIGAAWAAKRDTTLQQRLRHRGGAEGGASSCGGMAA